MEPMQIREDSPHRGALTELAFELSAKSAGFASGIPDGMGAQLATLVRSMNCYYSNLIEGHRTHPVDIERAMNEDYASEPEQRNLQLEARAHVTVQRWLDDGGLSNGRANLSGNGASLREIHRRFAELLPESLLWMEDPATEQRTRIEPGEFRTRDVKVGRHIAISPGAVPRFLARFEQAYAHLGKVETILAAAARAPSAAVDPSFSRRQWPRGPPHVPRTPAAGAGQCRDLVHLPRACPAGNGVQVSSPSMRFSASGRPGWSRPPERTSAGRLYPLFSGNLHRSGRIHGGAGAA